MTNFRKKVDETIVENWEKGKVKKLRTFQKLLEYVSLSHNQSRQSLSSRGNVYEETDQELGISGNTDIIPK